MQGSTGEPRKARSRRQKSRPWSAGRRARRSQGARPASSHDAASVTQRLSALHPLVWRGDYPGTRIMRGCDTLSDITVLLQARLRVLRDASPARCSPSMRIVGETNVLIILQERAKHASRRTHNSKPPCCVATTGNRFVSNGASHRTDAIDIPPSFHSGCARRFPSGIKRERSAGG